MSSSAPTSPSLRKIVEDRLLQLSLDLERWCEGEVRAARSALAEQLNQSLRRLRQAAAREALAATLVDVARPFCNAAAVFSVSNHIVQGVSVRGLPQGDDPARIRALEFPLAQAAALAGAVAEREPVVALSTSGEIPPALAQLFGQAPGDRVHSVPVIAGGEVKLLLYAGGVSDGAALQVLAEMAGAALETQSPAAAPAAAPDLIQIQPGLPVSPITAGRPDWPALTAAQQQAHLAAQRFARVTAAELRLYRAADVKAGRQRRDLYSALKDAIDRARDAFRERFLQTCPGMLDYLHQELVRTLAHDDPEMLGPGYPGPLQ